MKKQSHNKIADYNKYLFFYKYTSISIQIIRSSQKLEHHHQEGNRKRPIYVNSGVAENLKYILRGKLIHFQKIQKGGLIFPQNLDRSIFLKSKEKAFNCEIKHIEQDLKCDKRCLPKDTSKKTLVTSRLFENTHNEK